VLPEEKGKEKRKGRKLEGEESPAHKQPNNISPPDICLIL
jgi:hypothetical protein